MKLVMVHGRSQQGQNPVVLRRHWLSALNNGLKRAGRIIPSTATVELPFYGDELDRLVKKAGAPLGGDVRAKGTASDAERDLRGEILIEIAQAMGITETDIEREFDGQPREKGPLNWKWVHAILRAIDRIPGLNSDVIDTFTRDVYVYLTYPAVRKTIDALVEDIIGKEPFVILSHSLGTIVAYNVLTKRDLSPSCRRFVTVGSPLGIKAIKARLDSPLKSPACVDNWFNAYDDRDVVALIPLDKYNFGVTPPIENKGNVRNFTDNRHGIAGYLADKVVASKVVQFL